MKSCLGPRCDGDRCCLLHRIFPSLRALLGLGIADADSHVRKTFRQIFWVTGQRSAAMAAELQAYFLHDDAKKGGGGGGGAASIAPAVQKVLRAEVEGPASAELAALLQMARNPQEVADTLNQHLLWGSGAGPGADAPSPVESSDGSMRSACDPISDGSSAGDEAAAPGIAAAAVGVGVSQASRRSSLSGAARVAR